MTFHYDYRTDYLNRLLKITDTPVHLEIHPGIDCSGVNCHFCFGKGQNLDKSRCLSIDDYRKFFNDIKGKINFIEISGIKSDPLSSPHILEILREVKKLNIQVGIHTKGIKLSDEIISEIIQLKNDSYITISHNSTTVNNFKLTHGSDFFNVIDGNIKKLYSRKNNKLRLNLSFLVTDISYKSIHEYIDMYEDHTDFIKLSFPQTTNLGEEPSLKYKELKIKHEKVIFIKSFHNREINEEKKCKAFHYSAVMDCSGNIFPCPQVCTTDYKKLIIGNIQDLSFWEIWNGKKRQELAKKTIKELGCGVCSRKDEIINNLEEL